jgi:hypothetical protein
LKTGFGGGGDVAEALDIDGQWLLRGFGNVVTASAVCVSTQFVKQTGLFYVATSGSHTLEVATNQHPACFLTSMRGRLNGQVAGVGISGAQVFKNADGTRWKLRVDGQEMKVYMRCVSAPTLQLSDEVSWLSGQAAQTLKSNLDAPCLLTKLTGNFSSPGDWGGLWLEETGAVLRQLAGGAAVSNSTSMGARCLSVL